MDAARPPHPRRSRGRSHPRGAAAPAPAAAGTGQAAGPAVPPAPSGRTREFASACGPGRGTDSRQSARRDVRVLSPLLSPAGRREPAGPNSHPFVGFGRHRCATGGRQCPCSNLDACAHDSGAAKTRRSARWSAAMASALQGARHRHGISLRNAPLYGGPNHPASGHDRGNCAG